MKTLTEKINTEFADQFADECAARTDYRQEIAERYPEQYDATVARLDASNAFGFKYVFGVTVKPEPTHEGERYLWELGNNADWGW